MVMYIHSYDEMLEVEGHDYYEVEVNYEGDYRRTEQLIYLSDGPIYYTGDHYDSFQQHYVEEE